MSYRSIAALLVTGGLLIAGPVGAANLLRTPLVLVKGEDPSIPGDCPVLGDARWTGTLLRVSLVNLDPSRFPADCKASVKVGKVSKTTLLIDAAAAAAAEAGGGGGGGGGGGAAECVPAGDTTLVDLRVPATSFKSGNKATVTISCKIGTVKHSTTWAGVF